MAYYLPWQRRPPPPPRAEPPPPAMLDAQIEEFEDRPFGDFGELSVPQPGGMNQGAGPVTFPAPDWDEERREFERLERERLEHAEQEEGDG